MSVAAQPVVAHIAATGSFCAQELRLSPVAAFPGMRALLWHGKSLYTCRGYEVYRVEPALRRFEWELVGRFRPAAWRRVSSLHHFAARLCRDGFHCLAHLPSGDLVGAVPGAIVRKPRDGNEFSITHRIQRGTRPLHITVTPEGRVLWGEYFDNPRRDEVHIYASADSGRTWDVAYTFPRGAIRHIHNVIFDEYDGRLWILTGDEADECKILRASPDFSEVEVVFCGDQQARAVALVPTPDGVYFASDTPFETNHVYRMDRGDGRVRAVAKLASSSIQGCSVGDSIFFSTIAEPSAINAADSVRLYGSSNGNQWQSLKQWRKDRWPMRFFQYGNAFLPPGRNQTDLLAVSTIAVEPGDVQTTFWQVIA